MNIEGVDTTFYQVIDAMIADGEIIKVEEYLNENEAKIKQMLLPPSFKTDVFGLSDVDLIVKLNFKGSLISG